MLHGYVQYQKKMPLEVLYERLAEKEIVPAVESPMARRYSALRYILTNYMHPREHLSDERILEIAESEL